MTVKAAQWFSFAVIGAILSTLGHLVVVFVGVMSFADPVPLTAAPPASIAVDIVTPAEAPPLPTFSDDPGPKGDPAGAQTASPQAQAAPQQSPPPQAPTQPPQQASQQQPPPQQPPQPQQQPSPRQGPPQPQPPIARQPTPPQQPLSPPPQQPGLQTGQMALSTTPGASPLYLPFVNPDPTPDDSPMGVSPPATDGARLTRDEVAAFRSHLQKCWTPPAGGAGSAKLQVVLRVVLQPNGKLQGEPTLLQASASADGPALMVRAKQALAACQPYAFLPADRYSEWQQLDLTFSPSGLSGG